MNPSRTLARRAAVFALLCFAARAQTDSSSAKRLVILKVDGLSADLLYKTMAQTDPVTGKSKLPWFEHIFGENGTVFENFYTRGISLSAPSWSMLDTGQHGIIRGNVEYDRYTGHVYDYLNVFPPYLGSARLKQVDMTGVQELDRAGIPLIVDRFPYGERFQGFQLFQRGVRLRSLQRVLERRFSSKILLPIIENAGAPSYDETLQQQMEAELDSALEARDTVYADIFTGDMDHEGHATNQQAALLDVLSRIDALAGRMWRVIQTSPLAKQTVFVVVSDHGMNNQAGIFSQAFSLTDLFGSAAGGGHHVVTNRTLLSDYTLKSLNPLTERVITPSAASAYLGGEAQTYPTAWFDLDGNERASVQLRNSEVNELHILLKELAKDNLRADVRRAAATAVNGIIERNRNRWQNEIADIDRLLAGLQRAIDAEKAELADAPKKGSDTAGFYKNAIRRRELVEEARVREHEEYRVYRDHLAARLKFRADTDHPFKGRIAEMIPALSSGDRNTIHDLQNYTVGLAASGLKVDASTGELNEEESFRHVNYFQLLAGARERNNPQKALSSRPIDFIALALSNGQYWAYRNETDQLLINVDEAGRIAVQPVAHLRQDRQGGLQFDHEEWRPGLPLALFEDDRLKIPEGQNRSEWLTRPHTEREWMRAIHECHYSNGLLGLIEDLSPIGPYVPGTPEMTPELLAYERWRRELVQPGLIVFAADHWNFNVRNFNPGGNHGSFFRTSTHSVWMMAGAGVPTERVDEPYDTLNFASTILSAVGKPAPMPDRVVKLTSAGQ